MAPSADGGQRAVVFEMATVCWPNLGRIPPARSRTDHGDITYDNILMLREVKAVIPINDIILVLEHRNNKKESKVDDLIAEDD